MKIIGLTGGIGSGKTTVAKLFLEFNNVAVYTADKEAKKLINSSLKIKKKIIEKFGTNAYTNNQLNSKYIAKIVFNNKEKLNTLNAIVHPEVKKHFKKFVNNNLKKEYIIYENAILFESKSNTFCNYIITVITNINTRINRIIVRDKTTKQEALARIKNQWLEDKKILQSNYVIYNNKLQNTKKQVRIIHNILTKKK